MTDLTIRHATTEDAPEIRRIAEAGWNATYESILEQETIDRAIEAWYDPESIRQIIEDGDVLSLVAERDTAVLGYASGGVSDEEAVGTLGAIYVDPDHWREGVGTALLTEFERVCKQAGCEKLEIRVLEENDVGTAFYRNRGYRISETQESELFGEPIRDRTVRTTIE
ncbi:MAG: N-acetyltransferase family protein [Halodesulfurarchaeum sp.]